MGGNGWIEAEENRPEVSFRSFCWVRLELGLDGDGDGGADGGE